MKTLDPDWPVFPLYGGRGEYAYDLLCEMEPDTDNAGREYEMVTQCLEDDDFYRGLNTITVIRRKNDGKLFGYSWWQDNSKHGEDSMEPNGDEYGLECDTDVEGFDWDTDYVSYYVFEPVEAYYITAYRKTT